MEKIRKASSNEMEMDELKGEQSIRKKPESILGTNTLDGAEHCFKEILANAIDEWREVEFPKIEIIKHKDNSITVRDYGRGCPVDWNEKKQKYNWELAFQTLYAGGKYRNNDEDGNYKYSLGTNGLGATATCYTSDFFKTVVWREGIKYTLDFAKGKPVELEYDDVLKKQPCDPSLKGTEITWLPDLEVFIDNNIRVEFIKNTLKEQSVVNQGLQLIFIDEKRDESYEFYYEGGIKQYVDELTEGTKNISDSYYYETETEGRDREDKKPYKLKITFAFKFNNAKNRREYYHNGSFLEYGGSPEKATQFAFTTSFNNYISQNGWFKKDESRLKFRDIEESLVFISNTFSTESSYEGQTKKGVTNPFIQQKMNEYIKQCLEIYFIENKLEVEKVCKQLLLNKRSRETAEKTRNLVKDRLESEITVTNTVEGLSDCESDDPETSEIFIVEGDSAQGSVMKGRNALFQAVIAVRGKIRNCLKSDIVTILTEGKKRKNIVIELIRAIGGGIDIKESKYNNLFGKYDKNKTRYNKIIILTDADADGYQIRCLILTVLFRLRKDLIMDGKVFIAESPLFEIESSIKNIKKFEEKHKGEYLYYYDEKKDDVGFVFAYTEEEKNQILKDVDFKYFLNRNKGLGEVEPPVMNLTTLNPDTRRLIKVTPDEIEAMERQFELFLGKEVEPRRKFIEENMEEYAFEV